MAAMVCAIACVAAIALRVINQKSSNPAPRATIAPPPPRREVAPFGLATELPEPPRLAPVPGVSSTPQRAPREEVEKVKTPPPSDAPEFERCSHSEHNALRSRLAAHGSWPRLTQIAHRSPEVRAEVAFVKPAPEHDDGPWGYGSLLRLTLPTGAALLLGFGITERSICEEPRPDGSGLTSQATYFGSLGVSKLDDGVAWLDALASATGAPLPPQRGEFAPGVHSAWIHHYGVMERGGERAYVLGVKLSIYMDLFLGVIVNEELTRAEVCLLGDVESWTRSLFCLTEFTRDGDFVRPTCATDPQLMRDEPLISALRELSGLPHAPEEVVREPHMIGDEAWVLEHRADEAMDVTCWRWPQHPTLSPRCDTLLRAVLCDAAEPSPDGSRVACVIRREEDGDEDARALVIVTPEGTLLGSSPLPPDLTEDGTMLLWARDSSWVAVNITLDEMRGAVRRLDASGALLGESPEYHGRVVPLRHVGDALLLGAWEHPLDHDLPWKLLRWELSAYDARLTPHTESASPHGRYTLRPDLYAMSFLSDGREIASRTLTSPLQLRLATNLYDLIHQVFLGEHLWAQTEAFWEVVDMRTGRAAPLLSEEDEERVYMISGVSTRGTIVLFLGGDGVFWGELKLPREMEASLDELGGVEGAGY